MAEEESNWFTASAYRTS